MSLFTISGLLAKYSWINAPTAGAIGARLVVTSIILGVKPPNEAQE